VLLWVIGFRLPPGPETAAQWAVLALACGFLALGHSGFLAVVGGSAARARRAPAAFLATTAAMLGLFYAALALSLVKFLAVRSHLRWSDLRFVTGSLAQVAGEATAAERRLLVFALLLPLTLAAAFFALLWRQRASARALDLRAAALLLAAGLGGLGALAASRAEARWLLRTLVPEGAIPARWAEGLGVGAPALPPPDPARQQRIAPYAPVAPHAQWNVVVVMLESVPWKRVLGPQARPESTPRLLEFARESIVFERAYAASVHSDYAQTAIVASLYPYKSEQHDFFVDLDYPRLLPWDLLGPLGWRSALFSTQNERWGNMQAFLKTPALELFRHAPDFAGAARRGGSAETKAFEESVVPAFLSWAGGDPSRPFVVYLNFQATHFPYAWPESFAPPFGEAPVPDGATFVGYPREAVPAMLDRFHNALAYQDLWLGRLIDGLRAQGAWERTALVVVADHGEAFHEHGLVTHGTALHEEQVRVPMLLRLPGAAPRTIAAPVSVLDALPAVVRAMGLPRHGAMQGRDDVLEPGYEAGAGARAIPFSLQGMTNADGLVLGRFKWFVDRERRILGLYDLVDDPGETRNLAAAAPGEARRMNDALARFLAVQLGYYRGRGWESGWYPPRLP
jgi:arylsulfatase A-like enzyme